MPKHYRRKGKIYLKIDTRLWLVGFVFLLGFGFWSASIFKPLPQILSATSIKNSVFGKFIRKESSEAEFSDLVRKVGKVKGDYYIYVKDLNSDAIFSYNENDQMYAASLYKMPLAVATLKLIDSKKLSFTTEIIYTNGDFEGGTGTLSKNAFGTKFTVDQLLTRLLVDSDNVAQNMLLRKIGFPPVGEAIASNNGSYPGSRYYSDNFSSAREVGTFIENVHSGSYLSSESKTYFFSTLSKTSFDDRISAYLAPGFTFSHKIGNWGETNAWHDCGFASKNDRNFIICAMSQNTEFDDFVKVSKYIAEFVNYLSEF